MELEIDLPHELPGIVSIPGEIQQVVGNLLVNAAHAVELTGRYGTVHVEGTGSGFRMVLPRDTEIAAFSNGED